MSESPDTNLICYRLRQAHQALQESQVLLRENLLPGAVNRAYYAMFYAVEAMAVAFGDEFSKHSGAVAFFDRAFVKTGIFPREFSKSLHSFMIGRDNPLPPPIYTLSIPADPSALGHAGAALRSLPPRPAQAARHP